MDNLLEQEVDHLERQIENLRCAHQGSTYFEEQALLVEEISRLKRAVLA